MGSGHDIQNPIAHYRLIYIFRFLLVSLNIEAILQESTIYRRRERLNKMTDGLGLEDVYSAMIERIKAQGGDKSRLGMGALMWICHAVRPLRPEELCHALAIELGSKNFNAANAPSISTLVSCCQGLITVDKEGSTVRLIHFTLKEYLSAHPDIFSRPHSAMAEICLTYLNSQEVKAFTVNSYLDATAEVTSLLGYCSLHWGVHAKRELSNCARSLALELLREYDGHISAKFLLGRLWYQDLESFDANYGPSLTFSGLHCASFFGIVDLVAALIKMKCYDTNKGDFRGSTPLTLAACNGHEKMVKILLEREEVNPDKPDEDGKTPLSYAANYGHEEVIKILLEREEVNPNKPDNYGRTPLSCAAWCGHEGVVRILIRYEEVNPDWQDDEGTTPLMLAAMHGHEGVVKMLLEREEVNPDKPGYHGKTPLSYAASYGHEGVVKILLGRKEVNPSRPDNHGQTPLMYATKRRRNKGLIALLQSCEAVAGGAI